MSFLAPVDDRTAYLPLEFLGGGGLVEASAPLGGLPEATTPGQVLAVGGGVVHVLVVVAVIAER